MHKSGILKKAIDYINFLKKENSRLKDENISLKMAQQQQSKNNYLTNGMIALLISFLANLYQYYYYI